MYLIQERGLKRKRFTGLYAFLPSVQQLDRMGRRLLVAGLLFLSVSLGAGALISIREPDLVPTYKLVAAGTVWLGYLAVAILRQQKKLVSRRHAIAAILLFVAALATLWPVETARSGPAHDPGAPVEVTPDE
jgi:ABC-type transport system involved in cytochrome c biogenesis permease subunit